MEKQTISLTLPYGYVRKVSFSISPGECILLAGPNGCGKTTLLKELAGEGIVPENHRTFGPRPSHRSAAGPSHSCGHGRPQFSGTTPSPASLIPTNIPKVKGFTVEEFIRTGCYKESDWAGRLNKEMEDRMNEALEIMGLSKMRGRDISTLSDGEFQKACIAVGLTRRSSLLLLDEPTAFLDVEGKAMVLGALKTAAKKAGIGVIFSSHDLHASLQFCSRVLVMTRDGRFIESGIRQERMKALQEAFPGAVIA